MNMLTNYSHADTLVYIHTHMLTHSLINTDVLTPSLPHVNMVIDVFKNKDITSHTIINSLHANLHENSLNHMNIPTNSVTQVHEYITQVLPDIHLHMHISTLIVRNMFTWMLSYKHVHILHKVQIFPHKENTLICIYIQMLPFHSYKDTPHVT